MNEEFYFLFVKETLYPALGYPAHRDTYPGQQFVVICNNVDTRIGYFVTKTVMHLGLEIGLRVPNLKFALQR